MKIFRFSVGSEAKRVAVRCVFAIGVVCWANSHHIFFGGITSELSESSCFTC